jgi:GDP-L-fucose synthase
MAAASVYVMELASATYAAQTQPMLSHINVGFGSDVSIAQLAHSVAQVVDYQGEITFDVTKPDGAPRKLMDSARLKSLGWNPKVGLEAGLTLAYTDFYKNQ